MNLSTMIVFQITSFAILFVRFSPSCSHTDPISSTLQHQNCTIIPVYAQCTSYPESQHWWLFSRSSNFSFCFHHCHHNDLDHFCCRSWLGAYCLSYTSPFLQVISSSPSPPPSSSSYSSSSSSLSSLCTISYGILVNYSVNN